MQRQQVRIERNEAVACSSIRTEVSMDWMRALWSEMRAIAARHGRGGASDAGDDLAQELALAALQDGAAERPAAWLERVGRNAAIDRWRVERRRQELVGLVEPPPAPADPEAALLARERRAVVRRALVALPRAQRRAAVMRFHGELGFEAIGARLGTEAVTARTRVHRALAQLRTRVRGLRAWIVGWQAAQATVLGLALVTAVHAPGPASRAAPLASPSTPLPRRLAAVPAPARRVPSAPPVAPPTRLAPPAPRQSEPQPEVFVFGDDLVAGEVLGPDGERIVATRPVEEPSLIELRRDFLPEMVKSLEDL
jgi:RNA polymerase sigma factor (sigma-70 family)